MPTGQWLAQWKSNLFWSVLVGAVVGFLTNIGSSKLMEETPSIAVSVSVSYVAGQTVADAVIFNSGDLPLRALRSEIRFERPVTCSVSPPILQPKTSTHTVIAIRAPSTFVLAPSDTVDIRCTGAGANAILNKVADVTSARAVIEKHVVAAARSSSHERVLLRLLFATLGLLVLLLALVAILVIRSRRLSITTTGSDEPKQVIDADIPAPEKVTK